MRKDSHELWSVWRRLVGKCHDPRDPRYHMWGAIGFTVDDRWRVPDGFWNFVDDVPPRPIGKNPNGRSSWRLQLVFGTEFNGQTCRWAPARAPQSLEDDLRGEVVRYEEDLRALAVE